MGEMWEPRARHEFGRAPQTARTKNVLLCDAPSQADGNRGSTLRPPNGRPVFPRGPSGPPVSDEPAIRHRTERHTLTLQSWVPGGGFPWRNVVSLGEGVAIRGNGKPETGPLGPGHVVRSNARDWATRGAAPGGGAMREGGGSGGVGPSRPWRRVWGGRRRAVSTGTFKGPRDSLIRGRPGRRLGWPSSEGDDWRATRKRIRGPGSGNAVRRLPREFRVTVGRHQGAGRGKHHPTTLSRARPPPPRYGPILEPRSPAAASAFRGGPGDGRRTSGAAATEEREVSATGGSLTRALTIGTRLRGTSP